MYVFSAKRSTNLSIIIGVSLIKVNIKSVACKRDCERTAMVAWIGTVVSSTKWTVEPTPQVIGQGVVCAALQTAPKGVCTTLFSDVRSWRTFSVITLIDSYSEFRPWRGKSCSCTACNASPLFLSMDICDGFLTRLLHVGCQTFSADCLTGFTAHGNQQHAIPWPQSCLSLLILLPVHNYCI